MPGGYSYSYRGTEGFDKHAKDAMETITNIIQWGRNKGINNPKTQMEKLGEELLEAKEALTVLDVFGSLDIYSEDAENHLYEELGDIGVVWLLLCDMLDIDPMDALEVAHDKNKDRKGKTIEGCFYKDKEQ